MLGIAWWGWGGVGYGVGGCYMCMEVLYNIKNNEKKSGVGRGRGNI